MGLFVDVDVPHLIAEHVRSVGTAAEISGKMSAGLRLCSDPDKHNDSVQKELQKPRDADSPDLLNIGTGVSSWLQEGSLSTDDAGSEPEDSLSLLLFRRHGENEVLVMKVVRTSNTRAAAS